MIRVDETDPVGEVEPSFPYRDVTVRRGVDFKDQYDIQSEIGRGKFGTVYQCKEKASGLVLAAKVVTTTRKEDRRSVEREVEIMRRLQHPRLIQLYDAIDTGKQIYVILEMIQGGELFERVIDDDFVLTERSCAVFMRQICEGIEFVHAQHILHLDMKPENILCLTKEGNRIKIIDFGLARHYDPRKKMQVLFGTPEFVAPEVVNFDQIGFGTDMWSIGVICYVLLSGLSPFMGDTDVETMANVTIAKYDFDHDAFADISEDAKDFIRCLLVKDKEKRATATLCRSHRWLAIKTPSPRKKVVEATMPIDATTERKKKPKDEKITTRKDEVCTTSGNASMRNELDVTKDNLRLFVERWREHPDSPYSLETCEQPINNQAASSQSMDNNLELVSLRGQSPSPCGSVCSVSSELSDPYADKSNYTLSVPESVMFGLERRASEGYSSHAAGHRIDQASQIILAEEIIKLSEHLRNLAMSQPVDPQKIQDQGTSSTSTTRQKIIAKSTNGITKDNEEATRKKAEKKLTKNDKINAKKLSSGDTKIDSVNESNEISEKLSSITRQRKINGTTFNGNRSYDKQETSISNIATFSLKKTRNKGRKIDDGDVESNEKPSIDERNEIIASEGHKSDARSRVTWKLETDSESGHNRTARHLPDGDCTNNNDNSNGGTLRNERDIDMTPPWRRARTKHRFGEKCRDVPRISNLRDIHKNLNLDEPKSTKDLLLHLLGEWDDNVRPSGGIGRKSISVDWCAGEESVARRSMNSLAEYFQSEQQKSSTTTSLTNNATSTSSVHR